MDYRFQIVQLKGFIITWQYLDHFEITFEKSSSSQNLRKTKVTQVFCFWLRSYVRMWRRAYFSRCKYVRMCVFLHACDANWGWVVGVGFRRGDVNVPWTGMRDGCYGADLLWGGNIVARQSLMLQYCGQNYSKMHDSDDSVCFSPKTSLDKPFFSIAQHMTFLHVRTLRSCTRFQVPARMTCCRPEKDLLLLFWNAASTAANAYYKTRMSILPYHQSLYVRNYASWISPITSVHINLIWNSKTPQEFLHGLLKRTVAVFRRCVGSLQLPASL